MAYVPPPFPAVPCQGCDGDGSPECAGCNGSGFMGCTTRTRTRREWTVTPNLAGRVAAGVRLLVWILSWGQSGQPLWRTVERPRPVRPRPPPGQSRGARPSQPTERPDVRPSPPPNLLVPLGGDIYPLPERPYLEITDLDAVGGTGRVR